MLNYYVFDCDTKEPYITDDGGIAHGAAADGHVVFTEHGDLIDKNGMLVESAFISHYQDDEDHINVDNDD
jgi:hypothetical protein